MQLFRHFQHAAPLAWRVSHLLAFAEVPLDPNPHMRSFEIQRLAHGTKEGCNVVIHRFDGTVEVHHERTLGLQPGWTKLDPAFAHMNVTVEEPADLSGAICRVDEVENRIEATIVDSLGANLSFQLRFTTTTESGPIFIPSPPCSNPTQMRFLTLNRFRLVDSRTADLEITHNGHRLEPQLLIRNAPKHKLAARSGSELLCASLCSPDIQTDTIWSTNQGDGAIPQSVTVRNPSGHFTLQLDSPDGQNGSARVLTRLGQVASAQWELAAAPQSDIETFRLFDITQDWRPSGVAPTKHALRIARRYRRRSESWAYTHASGPNGPVSDWSN